MSRIGRRAKARRTKEFIFGTLAFLLVAGIVCSALYYFVTKPKGLNPTTMCPADGPSGHYILLVDKTDPLTFTQRAALNAVLRELIEKRIPEGYLVSVFALGEDYKENAEPVVELCNPGTGAGKSDKTANLKKLRQQYELKFSQPLKTQVDSLLSAEPAKSSPIFEMLQLVEINGFRKASVAGERKLVVVSDMLHNTKELSMFKEQINFLTFMDTAYGKRTQPDLHGVDVELNYLMNYPQLQTKRSLKFWEDYFNKAGARLVAVRPLEG